MVSPSGTDIRRMLAKARAVQKGDIGVILGVPLELTVVWANAVEAALAWILGERDDPPIA